MAEVDFKFPLFYIDWHDESVEQCDDEVHLETTLEFYDSEHAGYRKDGVVVDSCGKPVRLKLEFLEIIELRESDEPTDERAVQILSRPRSDPKY